MGTSERPVVVIGAGVAGLAAALELACHGRPVTLLERAASPGGKLRRVAIDDWQLDAGPTVLTMRGVLDDLFVAAGTTLAEHLQLVPVEVLARHAWGTDDHLDLYTDPARSAAAIGRLAGAAEARRYLEFVARARRIYETVEGPFIRTAAPSVAGLVRSAGAGALGALATIAPFRSLWSALGDHFHDPRLRQLFGRYATYVGSSPFDAPATLMLVAHVEQAGVWLVRGGMHRIAVALAALARARGVEMRYATEVREVRVAHGRACGVTLASGERLEAAAVVVNGDASALGGGLLGRAAARGHAAIGPRARSLSAMTWNVVARTSGFPLAHHTVFFSSDYAREFDEIFARGRMPTEPTVYVCAQDRDDAGRREGEGEERLLCLINAPANGDRHAFTSTEVDACAQRTFARLERSGLTVVRTPARTRVTTPADFHALFPGTGGALYGRASHGWRASFQRPGVRSPTRGLYLAGGSVHPGPGVPMAALSGRLAAQCLLTDSASTSR